MNIKTSIERNGFAIIPGVLGVLDEPSRLELLEDIEGVLLRSPSGIRGLAARLRTVRTLAESASVRSLVEPVLGPAARLVRSILFNKNDQANWQVAWHQNLAIAVAEKAELEGYSAWSVKEGVLHVQPPEEILEHMLTIRVHLDPADETNGALWLSPGSHRFGRVPASEEKNCRGRREISPDCQ